MTPRITCLLDSRNALAECPTWDERANRLLWCDIRGRAIHAYDWESGARQSWSFPDVVGSFGLTDDDRFIVALRDRVVLFDPGTGDTALVAEIEADDPRTRLNDGKVAPDGSFFVGSMDDRPQREPIGALYRICPDGVVTRITDGLYVSNGLAWSPDGRTLYHSDSSPAWIDTWRFDPTTGAVTDRHRFANVTDAEGRPDGATVDDKGNYWSAGVSAGVVNCYAPTGERVCRIAMPVPRPTMPCFCGPDLSTMVVTSLRPSGDAWSSGTS